MNSILGVLKTSQLSKRFGEIVAVDNLSLEVNEGEIYGFLGPNGAGKSTSINMICGLLKPDSGEVFFKGNKLKGGDNSIKSMVGVCPQNIVLWQKLTCFEQLVYVAQLYGIDKAIAKKNADSLLHEMGLTEKRNKLASTLSGGMQRRLNIILALIHNPEIIIFDEPEAGLDPQSRILVRDYIKSLAKKKTIILTTHNMDEAERICDRIAIIDKGKLLLQDTPDNLKTKIGKGDVLEFEIASDYKSQHIIDLITPIVPDTVFVDNIVVMRALGIVNQLPEIIQILKNNHIEVKELKLRENTLEDVFISLTGKKLRQ